MSNQQKKSWYRNPTYWGVIIAVAAIIISIFIYLRPNPPVAPDFSLSVSPMQGSVQQGGVTQTTIIVKGTHGYKQTVRLSASGEPSNVVIAFIPRFGVATPEYTSTMTINVGSSVVAGDYTVVIKGTGADGKERSCKYVLTVEQTADIPPMSDTLTRIIDVQDAFHPVGWMGDWGDIALDDAFINDPHSEPTCIKVTYSAARSQGEGWAGVYWQYPEKNWGDKPEGRDLNGATRLTFWARGEKGGEKAEFKVGGITGKYPDSIQPPVSTGVIVLSDRWRQYTIDLTAQDLRHVIGGFCWVTNKSQNPHGCTIYLDDIRYE